MIKYFFSFLTKIFSITLSLSGPFIISFGTFSGLLTFLNIYFSKTYTNEEQLCIYNIYLSFLWMIAIYSEFRFHDQKTIRPESSSLENDITTNQAGYRSIIKNFLTGGASMLVNHFLDKNDISFYDVFKRPSYWENYPDNHKKYPIIRIRKGLKSMEIRFPTNKPRFVLVRETPQDSSQYGDFKLESLNRWRVLFFLAPVQFIFQLFK